MTSSLPPQGQTGAASSDGSFEKNMILELCPPGGVKAVPPPDKLANFSRTLVSLNSEVVCPIILDLLEDGQPWIIRAKALCVMETCIQSGTKLDGANEYRNFFHACHEEVIPLTQHPRAAIKEPAQRVLKLLGVSAAQSSTVAPVAAAPVAAAPNLLDFDETPTPSAAAPAPAGGASMFGGMQVKSGTSAPAPAASAAAAPTSTTPSAGGDLLGDLGAARAPAAPTVDAFSPAPAAPSDMFSQMSIKDEKKNEADDASSAAPAGGSAFGFINADAPSGASSPPEATAAPVSFDPLNNANQPGIVTPQTAQRNVMATSPEQMQALAYQQLLQQQQLQQQQMAMMAAAMQGGGVLPPGVRMVSMPGMYPGMGAPAGGTPQQRINMSFTQPKAANPNDKKFDFVKDAMKAGKK